MYALFYGLRPADRVVAPASSLPFAEHHAIFLGKDQHGTEWMIENKKFSGVQPTRACDFFKATGTVSRIERFPAGSLARKAAVNKALSSVGKPYHLTEANCEHFANDIQFGIHESPQVKNFIAFIKGFVFIAILIVLASYLFKGKNQ